MLWRNFAHKPRFRASGRHERERIHSRRCRLGLGRQRSIGIGADGGAGAGAGGDEREAVQEELSVEVREEERWMRAPQRLHERRVLASRVTEARQRGHERLSAAPVALAHRAVAPHAPSIGTGRGSRSGHRTRGGRAR